jgi:ubiquinone biosynthesis protein
LIEEGLGGSPDRIFRAFEWTPCACGSVSQVHRARLADGRRVAVKIRRPGVTAALACDLVLARRLARTIERMPGVRGIPLSLLLDEFGSVLQMQADFRSEADRAERVRRNLSRLDVLVPRTYREYSSASVLTLDYIPGLAPVGALELSPGRREHLAALCVDLLYTMVFVDGFVHADLHPGNLVFTREGRVALLDFGMIAVLEGRDLRAFAEFFFGMVTNRGEDCADILHETALYCARSYDRLRFSSEMKDMISRYARPRTRDFEVARFATDLFQIQRRNGVYGSPRFISVILSFIVFEGIVKQLSPALDFMGQARRFIPAVIRSMRTAAAVR